MSTRRAGAALPGLDGRTPAHGMVRSEPTARSRPRRRRSRIPGRTIPYGTQDGFCLPHSWVPGDAHGPAYWLAGT